MNLVYNTTYPPVRSLRGGHGGDEVLARVARSLGVVENALDLELYLGRCEEPVLPVARHAVELTPVWDGWSNWILHRKLNLSASSSDFCQLYVKD